MLIGLACDGAGNFPLLAGDDDDAGHSGPTVRTIAARVWIAGGRVPGELDGVGSVQPSGSGGAGDFQKAELLASGKRGGRAAGGGRQAGQLDGARIPAIAAADLRSAGDALCAWRRADPERADDQYRGDATADGIRHADDGAAGAGTGKARAGDRERA